jgi:hypothetical protein
MLIKDFTYKPANKKLISFSDFSSDNSGLVYNSKEKYGRLHCEKSHILVNFNLHIKDMIPYGLNLRQTDLHVEVDFFDKNFKNCFYTEKGIKDMGYYFIEDIVIDGLKENAKEFGLVFYLLDNEEILDHVKIKCIRV